MISGYMTRALKSQDRRFARVLRKLGYAEPEKPKQTAAGDEMKALREEYEQVIGRRPFNGWDAETLREKIAAAKADGE